MIPINIRRPLHVDLSSRRWYVDELDEKLYGLYLGGSGIAARTLYNELDVNASAIAPNWG